MLLISLKYILNNIALGEIVYILFKEVLDLIFVL